MKRLVAGLNAFEQTDVKNSFVSPPPSIPASGKPNLSNNWIRKFDFHLVLDLLLRLWNASRRIVSRETAVGAKSSGSGSNKLNGSIAYFCRSRSMNPRKISTLVSNGMKKGTLRKIFNRGVAKFVFPTTRLYNRVSARIPLRCRG